MDCIYITYQSKYLFQNCFPESKVPIHSDNKRPQIKVFVISWINHAQMEILKNSKLCTNVEH